MKRLERSRYAHCGMTVNNSFINQNALWTSLDNLNQAYFFVKATMGSLILANLERIHGNNYKELQLLHSLTFVGGLMS